MRPFDGVESDTLRGSEPGGVLVARPPWRSVALSLALLVVGVVSLLTSLSFFLEGENDYVAPLVIGLFTVIPGAYGSWMVLGVVRGWRGYTWDALPQPPTS